MRPLVVFGAGIIAELAVHYFATDSDRQVVALTVDREYRDSATRWGLPIVPFDQVLHDYPPGEVDFFIALSYSKRNAVRRDRFLTVAAAGYEFASYISSRATVLNGDRIGRNCFILENNTIQPFVTIGDNTMLWSGNHIGHHSTLGSHIYVASHVVVSGRVRVADEVFIGVNATIRDGVEIGRSAIIGAGSLIMESVPERSVVVGQSSSPLPPRGA